MKKNTTVNSNAYERLLRLVSNLQVLSLEVRGRWLTAELSSGIRFSVKNVG